MKSEEEGGNNQEIAKAKVRNQKLKVEFQEKKKLYQEENNQADDLVPPNTLQKLKN